MIAVKGLLQTLKIAVILGDRERFKAFLGNPWLDSLT